MNGRGVGDSERPNGRVVDVSHDGQEGAANGSKARGPAESFPDEVDPCERRSSERVEVLWSVDCETEDTFLYASITNISEMGIFVRTTEPLAIGTAVTLRFAPPHQSDAFVL